MGEDGRSDLGMGQQGEHTEAVAALWAGGDVGPPNSAQQCRPIKPARWLEGEAVRARLSMFLMTVRSTKRIETSSLSSAWS